MRIGLRLIVFMRYFLIKFFFVSNGLRLSFLLGSVNSRELEWVNDMVRGI